jgi:hypothetical protein
MDLRPENFDRWTPIRLYGRDGRVFVDWCYLGEKRFTESFHDATIDLLLREPFNALFRQQTPIEFLGELAERRPGLAPRGFIFHVSRCGSTLVSQMLAALEKNIVVSEPAAPDKILRPDRSFPFLADEQKIIWLRWMLSALARRRFPAEENFFVKFDCWSAFDLALIERAFPGVPWVFIYRRPVEVIVSHLRQPGAQMIPGAIESIFPGLGLEEILRFSHEERFARTVAAFFRAGLAHAASPRGRFIDYDRLPAAVTGEIVDHFGLSFSAEELEKMEAATKFHAKNPRLEFAPDTEKKRKEASAEVVRAAADFVDPLYEEMKKLGREPFLGEKTSRSS